MAENRAADELMELLENDPRLIALKNNRQHTNSNTYDHMCHVTRMSRKLSRAFHIDVDEMSMIKGAMLHDYYLYEYASMKGQISPYAHGVGHAAHAVENAERDFGLNDLEREIIYSHMWPLNITRVPKSKEAWVVTMSDKICTVAEVAGGIQYKVRCFAHG